MGHVSGAWFTRAGFNHLINQGDLGVNTQQTNQIAFPRSPGQGKTGLGAFAMGNHGAESKITLQVNANALV